MSRTVFAAALLCWVLPILAAAEPSPFVGTFKDEQVTLTVNIVEGGFTGTLKIGDKVYNCVAREAANPNAEIVVRNALEGRYADGDKQFAFTARLTGDSLALKTDSGSYKLARQKSTETDATPKPPDSPPTPATRPTTEPAVKPPVIPSLPVKPPAISTQQSGPSNEQIEAAIGRARDYLLAQQKNGTWDHPARAPEPRPSPMGINMMDIQNASQWGGVTALATYALLASGENPTNPKVAAAIEFLKRAELNGTYSLAMRAQVWNSMPKEKRKDYVRLAQRDRDLLMKNRRIAEPFKGMFRYLPAAMEDKWYDSSASQFAVLGMWACEQMGVEVPAAFWKETEDAWIKTQHATGGWTYGVGFTPPAPVTPSMTAAGIATLFITLDMLHNDVGADCKGNVNHQPIERGIKWFAEHFDSIYANNRPLYALYGMERIGLASGYKYLGKNDWYKFGVEKLLATQQPDGGWEGDVADTCFALLFLVRGRNPIFVNKLEYQIDMNGDKPRESNWNERPRDCANLSKWYAKEVEHEMRWQIVNLSGPPEDLLEAPILYVSGNQRLALAPADEAKLRQFVEQGGLIVGHADCSNPGFGAAFKALGKRLFHDYEFRDLPANHLIYSCFFDRKKWKLPPPVQGLSNGAREMMLLIPTGDPGRFWQSAAYFGHEGAYELMGNIYVYATDKSNPRVKPDPWVVYPSPAVTPTSTIKIARLEYGGNWNPEPAGWRRMAAVLHNDAAIDLTVEPVKLGDGKLKAADYKIAHVTGTAAFTLSAPQRAELKAYLLEGGTLIADAAGGDAHAVASLEAEIETAAGPLKLLASDHAAYANLGMKSGDVPFRRHASKTLGAAKGARLKGAEVAGRQAVYYSAEDLSVGIVGQPVDGIVGYTPAAATAVMKSIIMNIK